MRILHAQTRSGFRLGTCLESAREPDPFDPSLFEGDDDFDAEEVEDMREDDLRPCTRDGLFVEQALEWLLDQGK